MKIYTKTGDTGQTALFGGGKVPKHHARIEAYGTVDELNALFGCAILTCTPENRDRLQREMSRLFVLGAHLATPKDASAEARSHLPKWDGEVLEQLEKEIDRIDASLPELQQFILPGGCEAAARLHLARTVCRRMERSLVRLTSVEPIDPAFLAYVNRLGDWLFLIARQENQLREIEDVPWTP